MANRLDRYIVYKAFYGRVVETRLLKEARKVKNDFIEGSDTIIWDREGENIVSWCKGCEVK